MAFTILSGAISTSTPLSLGKMIMKPPLRIAILECDTPPPDVKAKFGPYGTIFKTLLDAAADALGQPDLISSKKGLELSSFNVVEGTEYPNLEDVDAVLISGSKHDSFADTPWILELLEFTKKLLDQDRVRIIGVCFGHQIIGRAVGVKVGRGEGWEISVLPVELTKKGKEIFKQDTLSLHQMHRDIVFEYPKDIEALGASPRCLVQGMYKEGKFISVQGHPEFNEQIVTRLVNMRHEQGLFDDEMAKDALERVGNHHDGVIVAMGFLRFLLED